MNTILKSSFKEVLRSWKFSTLFVLSLSLGLAGFFILESFKSALTTEITATSKQILSADLSLSARRKVSEQELSYAQTVMKAQLGDFKQSEAYEFFAMLNTTSGSRLVLVKAIDGSYPFYGEIEFESGALANQTSKPKLKNSIWVSQDLKNQLQLSDNQTVKLGAKEFKVSESFIRDSTQTFRAATFAPRIFIDLQDLASTELIKFGSTFTHIYLFKFVNPLSVQQTNLIVNELFKVIPDPALRIDTPETASEQSGRQLNYLFDFLGLVAIVALFLSSMGGVYLFRLFLNSKTKQIAIYRSLGFLKKEVFQIYFFQILALSLLALVPATLIAFIANPIFAKFISQVSSFQLNPVLEANAFLVCLGVAILGGTLTSLHPLFSILKLKPSQLFSGENQTTKDSLKSYLLYLPAFLFFTLLAIYQAHSWKIGSVFILVMIFTILFFSVLGFILFSSLSLAKYFKSWEFKYSFLSISRNKKAALSVFISLGLGALLMNLLPQLKNSLQNEFRVESKSKTPSLFMFDIQDDQIEDLKNFLKQKNIEPMSVSPMVRARILKINGKDYERQMTDQDFKTREQEREARMRNRGLNLTYKQNLSESETIVDGKPFSGEYDFSMQDQNIPFEVSVEQRYAGRLGLNIGDKILFDVQGLELEGIVVNLRKVKWTTFQPNFFMVIQPGVLEMAPKTFIVSVPQFETDFKNKLQSEITEKFSNVSVLDVTRTVEDTISLSEKMSWSLELMSLLALLAGYIILFSVIRTHLENRKYELSMLKVLGARSFSVLKYVMAEYVALSFIAAAVGGALSLCLSYGISYFIFEGVFTADFKILGLSLVGITVLGALVAFVASLNTVLKKPAALISDSV